MSAWYGSFMQFIREGHGQPDPIVLLGVWNTTPLETSRWFDTAAIAKLRQLTGVTVRAFTYVQDELHYQGVFARELAELRSALDRSTAEQTEVAYVSRIYDDFYREVSSLERYLDQATKIDYRQQADEELIDAVHQFFELWTAVTMQIWYAVFLDLWYPSPSEQSQIKQIAAKARDLGGHLHERSNTIERRLYAEAAQRLGLTPEAIEYLFPHEIVDGLANSTDYSVEIARRKQFCVTTSVEGAYQIYSGEKARELFETYRPPSLGAQVQRDLRGIPACGGRISGKVKIIRRNSEFEQFQPGDVLVAPQTMVHYLPIMKLARAILTEFGGMTSHAAIVSRELGIPSIVGIPNLLASLKNGDMVEVNGHDGTVRVIN